MDNEEKLLETVDITPKQAYTISRFTLAVISPDFGWGDCDRKSFLYHLGSFSTVEDVEPNEIEAFEDFKPIIQLAEDLIARPGYTYEEAALMLDFYCPSGLTESDLHEAQSDTELMWKNLFLKEAPTIGKPQSDLRSMLGIFRTMGMMRNGRIKFSQEYVVEEIGWPVSAMGYSYLPLKPLDPEWEHDPAYLRTQIQLWEEYFLQIDSEHKESASSTSLPPVILKPTVEELHEAQMLCLYKLLEIPLNGNREEALNSGTFPGWFIEIANREGYLMMPSLATLEISVGQGRDELVAMWPEAFQQWLKDRSLFHRTPKPVKATPAWASPERLNPETMTTDDKRALAWREFDAAQAAEDKE